MAYLLVENRQLIHLGPISWRPRFIQTELDELEVTYTVPITEQGYIQINQSFEIIPVGEPTIPNYNPTFEQLVGPFYTYFVDYAISEYTVTDLPLETIKNNLKNIAASERYRRENLTTTAVIQGQTVTVDTTRGNRDIFVFKLNLMADNDIVNWKFPEGWITLTKTELAEIVMTGASYIQAQFDWESQIVSLINSATTKQELQLINILPPPVGLDI